MVFDSLQTCGLQPARILCPWGFSRQEYWSGLLYSLPGDLPNPGIEPTFPVSPALRGYFTVEPLEKGNPINSSHAYVKNSTGGEE